MESKPLKVRLILATPHPFAEIAASARTCYSSKGPVFPEAMEKVPRAGKIARKVFGAGHHTTLQHAHFTFSIENITRYCVWAFLHSHPFYNSEQVSQRYVRVTPDNCMIPPFGKEGKKRVNRLFQKLMEGYETLITLLSPKVEEGLSYRFKGNIRENKRRKKVVAKKAQEVARYILPLATYTYLHHTISFVTLLRYMAMQKLPHASYEQKKLVEAFYQELIGYDGHLKELLDQVKPLDLPVPPFPKAETFCTAFDEKLKPWSYAKRLTQEAQFPKIKEGASLYSEDPLAGEKLLHPATNPLLGKSLNVLFHHPESSALHLATYTFARRLSHTADSQEQRHRMCPGPRPYLLAHLMEEPDLHVPALMEEVPQARDLYLSLGDAIWKTLKELKKAGEDPQWLPYLLPNGVRVRFYSQEPLIHLIHKAKLRLCLNAQEEIWHATREMVQQVMELDPQMAPALQAPCTLRHQAKIAPKCPEGDQYCGIPVWLKDIHKLHRLI